ncbi:MAG: HDOD domain-containing protein [bacterium]
MNPESKNLKKMINQISDLPSLPTVIPRLLSALKNPSTSAAEVEKILLSDPSLTAKTLKLVNSSYYGLNRRIESLKDAIVYLGFTTVRNLALGASVIFLTKKEINNSKEDDQTVEFDIGGLWEKAIATGIAAETTARRIRYPKAEDAMLAGLLHILGTVILYVYFRKDLKKAIDLAHEKRCSLLTAENEIFGVKDPEIAGWLGRNWDLPENIICGLSYYHNPMQAPEEQMMLPLLVYVGEKIVRAKGIGWSGDNIGLSCDEQILSQIGITGSELIVILKQFDRDLKDASEFMEMARELKIDE